MSKLTAYASTSVSLFRTQDDLERLLNRHGITASRWTHFAESDVQPGLLRFEFEWQTPKGPKLGFRVEVAYQYKRGPKGGNRGSTREQAGRGALLAHQEPTGSGRLRDRRSGASVSALSACRLGPDRLRGGEAPIGGPNAWGCCPAAGETQIMRRQP